MPVRSKPTLPGPLVHLFHSTQTDLRRCCTGWASTGTPALQPQGKSESDDSVILDPPSHIPSRNVLEDTLGVGYSAPQRSTTTTTTPAPSRCDKLGALSRSLLTQPHHHTKPHHHTTGRPGSVRLPKPWSQWFQDSQNYAISKGGENTIPILHSTEGYV